MQCCLAGVNYNECLHIFHSCNKNNKDSECNSQKTLKTLNVYLNVEHEKQ